MPTKYIFIAAAFILFSAAAAFGQNGTIAGTVSYTDGTVIHDAAVQILRTDRSARTDESGGFRFENVPPGRYSVTVHVEGFADQVKTVSVSAGSDVTLEFKLQIASLREQVTVTASATEQGFLDSFQTVNAVGSAVIAERGTSSLGDVLEAETGVAKRSFGPGSGRPVIRGFDGDRVLVLEDGVRSGSIGSQSGDHGEPIDPLAAEHIEIVKGPATLLYGSNALGGVVNVIGHHEDDFQRGFRGNFSTIGSTADSQAAFSGGGEYGYKHFMFRGNLGASRTGDYATPLGRIENSASRSHNGSFGGGYFGEKAYLNILFSGDVRRYGIPFATMFEHGHSHEHRGIEEEDHDEEIDIRQRRYKLKLNGGIRDLKGPLVRGLQFNIDRTDYRHKELEVIDGVDLVGTTFDNETFSYRTLVEQQRYRKLTGRFGFEGFNRDYEVNGAEQLINGRVRHNSFSLFGLEEIDLGRAKVQFGGRLENNRYRPDDPELIDRSFTAFSGSAGINIGLWNGGAFVANYTHSNRAPALEELYNHGPHIGTLRFEIGDQTLRRETANGIDVSLRHQTRRFRISGDAFYYRLNNFVFLSPVDEDGDDTPDIEDGLPIGLYTQGNAAYWGAELSGEVKLTEYLDGVFGLDMVRAELADGTALPRTPPARARFGLSFSRGGFNLRPEAVFVADQDRVHTLETRTAGYGLFNIAGTYTIGRQHHAHIFSVNAYNLTDRLYRNHVSFIKDLMPEIGRGIRFGYTVRFF